MLTAVTFLVKKNSYPGFFGFAEKNSVLAKLLYNAALFRIRQTFTGWDKTSRTVNEQEVFDEIATAQQAYPSMKVRRVLGYNALIGIIFLIIGVCQMVSSFETILYVTDSSGMIIGVDAVIFDKATIEKAGQDIHKINSVEATPL